MFRRLNHGFVSGYGPICVDSRHVGTCAAGVAKRMAQDLPVPNPDRLAKLRKFAATWARKYLPTPIVPLQFDEWLESTSYSTDRKESLRDVFLRVTLYGVTKRDLERVAAFIKSEFYGAFKFARWINSRSDIAKVIFGPACKALEHAVFAYTDMFIKHVPVSDRPAKIAALRGVRNHCYATDYTAFESHFTPELFECIEFEVYDWAFREWCHWPTVRAMLAGRNKLRMRNGLAVQFLGKRCSGEMNTSLGNGLANRIIAEFLCDEQGCDLIGYVEGDDGLFMTNAVLTSRMYRDLGFTIKIEEWDDPCRASFCGLVFADNAVVRDPRKFLAGFGWTTSFIQGRKSLMDSLLAAKCLSVLCETPSDPIAAPLAKRCLELLPTTVVPKWVNDGYHLPVPSTFCAAFVPPSVATRVLYEQRFGVTIDCQIELAERIRTSSDFGFLSDYVLPTTDMLQYTSRYIGPQQY